MKKAWELLKELPKRLVDLLVKLVSMKGLVFIFATIALAYARIGFWEWLAATGLVIGGRYLEKLNELGGHGFTDVGK